MKKYFKNLKTSKDFEQIIQFFSFKDLIYFEKEIDNYEKSMKLISETADYPTIVLWWEGLIDTMSLINSYDLEDEIIYPSFNENLSGDNMYELRISYPNKMGKDYDGTSNNELFYDSNGFCREFETIDEAWNWIERNIK